MLSAVAVLAGTGAASAGTHSFGFATVGGFSYCDGGTAYTGYDSGNLETWVHTNNNCYGASSTGGGVLAGNKNVFSIKSSNNSDNLEAKNYGSYDFSFTFALPKKLKNGEPWELFCDENFSSFHSAFECNSGVLRNATAGAHKVATHSHTSTVSKVLAAMKNRG